MRLHLLEHDDLDFSNTNIFMWAEKKGCDIEQTYVCNHEKLPDFCDFDWLLVMGGSPHAWEEEVNPWLPDEKAFIAEAVKRDKMILGICFGASWPQWPWADAFSRTNKRRSGGMRSISRPKGRNLFYLQVFKKRL